MRNLTLKEIIANMNEASDTNLLHGGTDEEGGMALGQLSRIMQISQELSEIFESNTQLPAWVQSHITTAYENLVQVQSYIVPKANSRE